MKYHLTHLLGISDTLIISKEQIQPNINNILYKQYIWDYGRILFHKDNVIITSWARGTYKLLTPHIVEASWHSRKHILIFNNSYTKYIGMRIDDIVINKGMIDTSLQDTIPVSSLLIKPKNLVYFCAFHNKGYIDLLKILLSCVKIFSRIDTVDFLVFTSESFRSTIEELSAELNIPIKIQIFDFTTQHEAGCARLFIFNYKEIDKYDKILYMDTDITVQNDLSRIFELPIEDKVYAIQEYDINGEGHGAWFFDFTRFDKATPAINSGVLLFQNTLKMRKIFNDINTHIANLKNSGSIIPNCMDQSFIVYHLFRNNACDSRLMKDYVYLSEHNPPPTSESPSNLTMVHFVWPIGNTGHKLNRMKDYSKKLLHNYGLLLNSSESNSLEGVLHKKYTWITSISKGEIEFLDKGVISTSWGSGIYIQLDSYTFKVCWKSFSHILKMNSSYDRYTGLNIESFEIINGTAIKS
jgi:lipopolysaccharide biosynthesis glycosyltransferase